MSVEDNNLLISLVKRASSITEDFTTEAFVHLLKHLQKHEPIIVRDLLIIICDLLKEKGKKEMDLSKPLDVKDLNFKTRIE